MFQVQRFDPPRRKKTFRDLRADGKGGWIKGTGAMAHALLVLYRLDKLTEKKTVS